MIAALVILGLCLLLMTHSGKRIQADNDIIEKARDGEASEHSPQEGGAYLALFIMIVLVFIAVTMGLGGALAPGNW